MIFHQYSCGGCHSNLTISEKLVDPVKVRLIFNSICPSCGLNLSNQIIRRQIELCSVQPSETPLLVESYAQPKLPLNFRTANELQPETRLYLGEKIFDQFIGGLRPGQIAFFYGSQQCLTFSQMLCVRVQLTPQYGGLDSKAIFIDGANTIDPYLIVQYAIAYFSTNLDRVLDRILVSRAFTYHQLTSLILKTLPEEIHKQRVKLIIVSDVIKLYRDSNVECTDSLYSLKVAINSLVTTARLEKAIVLVTSFSKKTSDLDAFLRAIKQRVDIILRFEETSTKIILEKHPAYSEGAVIIKKSAPRVLEEFSETTANG